MTNEAADVGGAGSLITGVILFIVDKVQLADINDILVTITTLGGAIWMAYKIAGQRTENKIKRKKLDELEKDS